MHHTRPSPSPYLYLAAIVGAATATACWFIRREGNRVVAATGPSRPAQIGLDPESIAAARTLARQIIDGSDRRNAE